jgi:hypothetical protein
MEDVNICFLAKDLFNNDMTVIMEPVDDETLSVSSIQNLDGIEMHDDYQIYVPVWYSKSEFVGGFKVKKYSKVSKRDLVGII